MQALEPQANFKLTNNIKGLTPHIVGDFNADDSYDAFKELRWGWRDGLPECPKCKNESYYEHKRVSTGHIRLKCKKCSHNYSATSKSVFSGAKMPHKNYLACLSNRIHIPMTITELAERVSINYRTAWSLSKKFNFFSVYAQTKTQDAKWPYLTGREKESDVQLLAKVSAVLPDGMPEQVRGDVGQELVAGLLMGDFTEESLASQVRRYVTAHHKSVGRRWQDFSMDQTRGDKGSWHDFHASGDMNPEENLIVGEVKTIYQDPTFVDKDEIDIDQLRMYMDIGLTASEICNERRWAEDEVSVLMRTL